MGIPSEDTFSWYEKGSLIRKAYQLYGKSKDFFLAHGMADTNVRALVPQKKTKKRNTRIYSHGVTLVPTFCFGYDCCACLLPLKSNIIS